jgi:hypothetical protein
LNLSIFSFTHVVTGTNPSAGFAVATLPHLTVDLTVLDNISAPGWKSAANCSDPV